MVTTELAPRVILKDRTNWTDWLMALKSKALEQEVWKYIDPESDLQEPGEPELPSREAAEKAAKESNEQSFNAHMRAWEALPSS